MKPSIEITTLHLFRHGETDWNREERFQGHLDIPLNETGRAQARALAERLGPRGLQAIVSSDLSRARETAELALEALSLLSVPGKGALDSLSPRVPIFTHPGLREAHLGEAQGLTHAEISARFGGELVTRWRSNLATDADVAYPGGEKGSEVLRRVLKALEDFALAYPEWQNIGVATHGGVIRRVMQSLMPEGSEPVPIPNGVIYAILFDRRTLEWRLAD